MKFTDCYDPFQWITKYKQGQPPVKHKRMSYRKVNDCFNKNVVVKASHELYEDFKRERTDISKFVFYLWLERNELETIRGKDKNGNHGFGLEFIPNEQN